MKNQPSSSEEKSAGPAAQKLVRLALVEDVAEMRESWRKLMDGLPGFRCVCTCANGREALKLLPVALPDVIVMDIQMPGMSGIECTLRLKQLLPNTPIL